MKKFLSLVLALVMTMSLVTVSAGAKDFTDDSSITYDEAVAVISELGIVDGYEDGSFGPTATLTRGAAAKIICNLILGPTTASALAADAAPYSDVPTTNTFAGYIAYCQQQGIISGYADGTFRPGNTLTGYAFMKMLLGALGYDSDIEGFTGSNWSIAVGKLALGIDLDDGNDSFIGTTAVTREEACLYAFNTLKATMVEYNNSSTITVGDVTVVSNATRSDVENNSSTEQIEDDDLMQFAEKYFTDLKKDEGNDDFGRPSVTWYVKSTEIGTYVNTDDLKETWTAKVTKGSLYSAVGSSIVDDLEDGDATLYYWVDGVRTVVDEDDVSNFMVKNNTQKINGGEDTGNGSLTEVYVDDDNNVTLVVIYTYVFQATSDYSSSSESVKIAAAGDTDITLDSYTLDGDDFDVADVAEDDYLLINATKTSSSSNKYEVQIVTPAEVIYGEVDAYSTGDDVTLGSETYEYSVKTDAVADEIQSTGGSVSLVLDQYGYVIAIDDSVLSGNYVFIVEAANATNMSSSSVVANAYFTDGTNDEITLKKITTYEDGESSSSTAKADLRKAAGWYTYSVDSSDRYSLTEVSGSYTAWSDLEADDDETTILSNGTSKLPIEAGSTTIRANESTVFVVVDTDGDVGVYEGISNAPDITVGKLDTDETYKVGYVYNKNEYANYVFISVEDINADVDGATEDGSYLFVTKYSSAKNDGTNRYYQYKAIVDGEEVSVYTEDTWNTMALYRKVRTSTSTGYITDMTEVTGEYNEYVAFDFSDVEVGYSSGVLSVGNDDFLVDTDSELFLILDYDESSNAEQDEGVYDLINDSGSDYTADSLSASALRSTLSGYEISGTLYAVVEDDYDGGDGNTTLVSLFLYVNEAVETDPDEDEDEKTDAENLADAQEVLDEVLNMLDTDEITVEIASNSKTSSAVKTAVGEYLDDWYDGIDMSDVGYDGEYEFSYTVTVTSFSASSAEEGDTEMATVRVKLSVTVEDQTASETLTIEVPVAIVAASN